MKTRLAFWAVLAAAVALLLVNAAAVPLLDPDESRFARTSLEMLRSQDLVVPHFEGEPRLVKPPLLHWLQAFIFHWSGAREWAARLPAILATLGSILLVGWIARRRFGEEGGVWAAACLTTMPLVVAMGRLGTLDALLSVHVLAVVALDLVSSKDGASHRALALGALLGLAFLIKGPVGVILPSIVILAGRTVAGREVMPSWASLFQALAAWCAVVLPWGLVFIRRVEAGEVWQVLRDEGLGRFFAGTTHVQPPWFYAQVVALGFLPWLGPLFVGLMRAWRGRHDAAALTALYAGAGLVGGLLFFSLSRSKLPNYIAPLAPLGALVVTWELGQELSSPRERTSGSALLAATLGACALLLGLSLGLHLSAETRSLALGGMFIHSAGALLAGWGAIAARPRWVYGTAAATSAGFLLLAVVVLFPAIGRQRSAAGLIETVPQLTSGRRIATVDMRVPSLTFYLDRPPEVVDMGRFEERLADADDPLFVIDEADLPAVSEDALAALQDVGRHGKYVVYEKRRRAP